MSSPNQSEPVPDRPSQSEIDDFIVRNIDSVPHMEALLLLWDNRPRAWSEAEIAARLFVPPDRAAELVRDLVEDGFAALEAEAYVYRSASKSRDRLMQAAASAYRRELVRISTLIHSKANPSARAFARAFRFGKKKE